MLQGTAGAVAGAGSTLGSQLALSAMCIDHAADRAAVAAKCSVRTKGAQLMHATDSGACWLRKNIKVSSWSLSRTGCMSWKSAAVLLWVKSIQHNLCMIYMVWQICLGYAYRGTSVMLSKLSNVLKLVQHAADGESWPICAPGPKRSLCSLYGLCSLEHAAEGPSEAA